MMRAVKPLLVTLAVFLGIAGVVFAVAQTRSGTTDLLNQELLQAEESASFRPLLYKPSVEAIGGYSYKIDSLVKDKELISFVLENSNKETIQISQQARPTNFDTASYKGRLQLNTQAGQAIIGGNDTATSAAIFNDKVLLFIRASHVVDDQTLQAMLSAFSPQER